MICLTRREDAITKGRWLQAGNVQGSPHVTVGSNDGETVWLTPQDALEFAGYLAELAVSAGAVPEASS